MRNRNEDGATAANSTTAPGTGIVRRADRTDTRAFATAAALCLLATACGDDDNTPTADGGMTTDGGMTASDGHVPAIDGQTPEADGGGGCTGTTYTPGMTVTTDTTFCPGTYDVSGEEGLIIGADGVTVEAAGLILAGTDTMAAVGIRIEGRSGVTIRGITAHGFRYGLVATDSGDVTIEDVHLDDNFHDLEAQWVQDSVQGGGIRLENVAGGRVANSTFARNWNGIELRRSSNVVVTANTADHCSNTGATLVSAHDNEISDNDMSWGIRGYNPDTRMHITYPDSWYSIDTKDSAGIILDAGSSGNRILRNDFTYGGDGIFLRAVIGGCAIDNLIEGNDTSYSPHNAIECWCDGNDFIDNVASHSHYGIWLGGTDRAVVRGNTVEHNVEDGISIQIGEERHLVIEDNRVAFNGLPVVADGSPLPAAAYGWYRRGVGMLLTGRQYQAWHMLSHWQDELANSSHLIVQRNDFEGNRGSDVYTSSTRSLLMASNCTDGDATPAARGLRDTDTIESVGSCGDGDGRTPPTAMLAQPPVAAPGDAITFDASGSRPASPSDTLSFLWTIQPSGTRFPPAGLPPAVFSGFGMAMQEVTFEEPGAYDVDVTVHDGALAGLAYRQVAVVPTGTPIGEDVSGWTYACSATHGASAVFGDMSGCTGTVAADVEGLQDGSVHLTTDAPFDFAGIFPRSQDLGLDGSATDAVLAFFVRARNANELGGWQGNAPKVVLVSAGGTITYTPTANMLPNDGKEWFYVAVPLAGDAAWTRVDRGGDLSDISAIELHMDTWGWGAYDVWIDAMTLYEAAP